MDEVWLYPSRRLAVFIAMNRFRTTLDPGQVSEKLGRKREAHLEDPPGLETEPGATS